MKKLLLILLSGLMLFSFAGCGDDSPSIPDGISENAYKCGLETIKYLDYWINDEIERVQFHSHIWAQYLSADKHKSEENDQKIVDILYDIQSKTDHALSDYQKYEAREAKEDLEKLLEIDK